MNSVVSVDEGCVHNTYAQMTIMHIWRQVLGLKQALKPQQDNPRKGICIIQIGESKLYWWQNIVYEVDPKTGLATHLLFIYIIKSTF